MGKYYYVYIENDLKGYAEEGFEQDNPYKELNDLTTTDSIFYSGPSALFINGIKAARSYTYKKNFLGYSKKVVYDYLAKFPMICELDNNTLIDVITGYKYKCCNDYGIKSSELHLACVYEITAKEVAEKLRSLDKIEIERYRNTLNRINQIMKIGYQKYLLSIDKTRKQVDEVDDFIKSFRKKYGD